MKKSLIALAALAAAGAASAQSSVTLYGILDVNVGYMTAGDRNGPVAPTASLGESITRMNADGESNKYGSRWGMRIGEDLGGGLKANAVLESGFSTDNGASGQGGRLFGRAAWVGLSSKSLGELRLGRQNTPSHEVMTFADPGDKGYAGNITESISIRRDGFGGTATTDVNGIQLFNNYGTRRDNMAQYITPNLAGFSGSLYVAAGEGTIARTEGGKLQYVSGPLAIGVSYEQTDDVALPTGGTDSANKNLVVGGSFDLKFAKFYAGFNQVDDFGQVTSATNGVTISSFIKDVTAYTLGVSVPFGAFTVLGNYTSATYDLSAGGDRDLQKFAITGEYAFSKRTAAYAQYQGKAGDLKDYARNQSEFSAGIWHRF